MDLSRTELESHASRARTPGKLLAISCSSKAASCSFRWLWDLRSCGDLSFRATVEKSPVFGKCELADDVFDGEGGSRLSSVKRCSSVKLSMRMRLRNGSEWR